MTKQIIQVFEKAIGKNNVTNPQPSLIGEDFSYYSLGKKIPSLFFLLGSTNALKYNESMQTGVALPGLHSTLMAPSPDITLKTGIKTMTSAVLELLKK